MNDNAPRLKAPAGTCDTHMHIYDARYPTAPTATFTPQDALVADYLKVRARLGIALQRDRLFETDVAVDQLRAVIAEQPTAPF